MVVLLAMEVLKLPPRDVTAHMVCTWRRRLKKFRDTINDPQFQDWICSSMLGKDDGPANFVPFRGTFRLGLREGAAQAMAEAVRVKLNPGNFLETGTRSCWLRLRTLLPRLARQHGGMRQPRSRSAACESTCGCAVFCRAGQTFIGIGVFSPLMLAVQ